MEAATVSGWEDFDRWCDDRNVQPGEAHFAFADWLASLTGEVVLGGPIGEVPAVVALPEESK